jgi:drug/metabolite transporter (DMT)-like permease
MSDAWLGALYSLGTAVSFGFFSLSARRGQQYANAPTGVMIGLFVMVPLFWIPTIYLWEPGWWHPEALFYFAIAGIFGPAISRVLYYESIHQLGVTRAMPLVSAAPLVSTTVAYIFLEERPGPYIWAGTVFIVAGCAALTSKRGGDTKWNRRALWMPFAGIIIISFSFLFRKIGMDLVPSPLLGAAVSSLAGLVFLFGSLKFFLVSWHPQLGNRKAWVHFSAAGAFNLFGFLFQFYALHLVGMSITVPLVSIAPLFTLLLSYFLLRDMERVTPWKVAGTVCIVLGAGLIAFQIE